MSFIQKNRPTPFGWRHAATGLLMASMLTSGSTALAEKLPIIDAHVHYSHDSVEMTPPARVIELMREAGLRRALVSSSDDNGTQLLSALAPDLIIPGLRPYRKRGEIGSWFQDPDALAYVEKLLLKNRYATIGEFHLYGDNADLPIPKRIVELAVQHNLILHAHSDADAVRRLFAHDPTVKVIWAHSGFDGPDDIGDMLEAFPNLWADLAFRSDMAPADGVSPRFEALFKKFPTRFMLGTDTYTPERIYFIPEHANESRRWLAALPDELAQNIAWRNAESLLMPVWKKNRAKEIKNPVEEPRACAPASRQDLIKPVVAGQEGERRFKMSGRLADISLLIKKPIAVSQPFVVHLEMCRSAALQAVHLDAVMPRHGHGMNYQPRLNQISKPDEQPVRYQARGLVLHMPGQWRWKITVNTAEQSETLTQDFNIQ